MYFVISWGKVEKQEVYDVDGLNSFINFKLFQIN